MSSLLYLFLGVFGFHHKPHITPPSLPLVETVPALVNDVYRSLVIAEMKELAQVTEEHPWLIPWIKPAAELGSKLLSENGTESDYDDDVQQLISDMHIIRHLENNDTI